jgi:para-aminobenzoate synthetase/4-amino-4-deoxychorismate lyase
MEKTNSTIPIEQLKTAKNTVLLETLKIDEYNFRSFLFLDPHLVLKTAKINQVESLLGSIDDYVCQGYYLAGFISYEAGYAFVPRLKKLQEEHTFNFPLLWLGVYKNPYIFDHRTTAGEKLMTFPVAEDNYYLGKIDKQLNPGTYQKRMQKIKEYLHRGETYQINYTWTARFSFRGSAFALYNTLKCRQPVSYAAYINTGEDQILSFSPELFFRRSGSRITAKPMKGTIRRGKSQSEDEILRQQLYQSEKNRAENLMIVDLLRNDLGRISEPGSVSVKKLFEIESYDTLFQMTSTIEGTLKHGTSYGEIFKSIFPCGSVTGAPKIRSMEIIKEIEYNPRGIYTGAIGYISPASEAVFNIAIRTPVIHGESGIMGIGSGIVWDSHPQEEYKECLLKMNFFTKIRKDFQIYESMLWEKGEYFLLAYHLERMAKSAAFFSFAFAEGLFLNTLSEYAKSLKTADSYKVRIFLNSAGKFTVDDEKIDEYPQDEPRIALAKQPVSSDNIFLYHKTTRREMYNKILKQGKAKGLWDVIFQNERGEISEGCRSNIFIKEQGHMITPPVSCGLLNGTMRRFILETDAQAQEGIITLQRLKSAEHIYMSNSVRKLVKVIFAEEKV